MYESPGKCNFNIYQLQINCSIALHRFIVISCLGCIRRDHRDKSLHAYIAYAYHRRTCIYVGIVDVRVEPLLILMRRTHRHLQTCCLEYGKHISTTTQRLWVCVCSDRNHSRQPSIEYVKSQCTKNKEKQK